jgi:hypothetical protein
MEAEDWYEKNGNEMFIGTADGDCTGKQEPRFITSTKHNHPEEEEEQLDKWDIQIDPANQKQYPQEEHSRKNN